MNMENIFVEFLPPWVETGLQPAFYDKESGTVLQQTARMYARVNMLIRMFNKLSKNTKTTVEEYINQFNELHDYVHDYFDNLDVQEEINNKLDEMVDDGTLPEIITQYINSTALWMFDTVSDMVAATNLIDGSYARTLGYNSVNDGGGATYKIRTRTLADNEDNITIIFIGTNLVAELTYEYNIPKASVDDIVNFIKDRRNIGHTFYANGLYEFGTALNLYENLMYEPDGTPTTSTAYQDRGGRIETVRIVGSGSENTIFKASNANALFTAITSDATKHYMKFEFENISFVGDNFQNTPFDIPKDDSKIINISFKNCNFNQWDYGFYFNKNIGTATQILRFVSFENCYFSGNNYGCLVSQDNVTFDDCYIKYNRTQGLTIIGTNVLNYNGGKIEYNGQTNSLGNDGNQIIVHSSSSTINFNGMYLEPTIGNTTDNDGTAPILLVLDEITGNTVLNVFNFNKSRFNALRSSNLIAIKGTGTINSINIRDSYILNLKLDSSMNLIRIKSGAPTINNCFDNSDYTSVQNSSGSYITDLSNLKLLEGDTHYSNVTPNFKSNIITTNLAKGTAKLIAGCFNSGNNQVYYGGSDFTFTTDETNSGIITVTLTKTNLNGSNTTYFPINVTLRNRSGDSVPTIPAIDQISSNQFRIHCRKPDGSYNNTGFTVSFSCLISY